MNACMETLTKGNEKDSSINEKAERMRSEGNMMGL